MMGYTEHHQLFKIVLLMKQRINKVGRELTPPKKVYREASISIFFLTNA